MATGTEDLSQDVVFEVLSSTRRRQVLSLLKNEGPMELTELAEHVAAHENDTTVEDLTKQQRKRVYVSLYQTHVPKLEDADLVEYDQDSGIVQLQARASAVDRYMGEQERFGWQYVYVALAAVGLGLIGLVSANVWIFAGLPEGTVAIALAVAITATAIAHAISWGRSRSSVLDWLR
jgi:DNA-binding transcriptional ArsR family regulator